MTPALISIYYGGRVGITPPRAANASPMGAALHSREQHSASADVAFGGGRCSRQPSRSMSSVRSRSHRLRIDRRWRSGRRPSVASIAASIPFHAFGTPGRSQCVQSSGASASSSILLPTILPIVAVIAATLLALAFELAYEYETPPSALTSYFAPSILTS